MNSSHNHARDQGGVKNFEIYTVRLVAALIFGSISPIPLVRLIKVGGVIPDFCMTFAASERKTTFHRYLRLRKLLISLICANARIRNIAAHRPVFEGTLHNYVNIYSYC